jgi:hypothetical protein
MMDRRQKNKLQPTFYTSQNRSTTARLKSSLAVQKPPTQVVNLPSIWTSGILSLTNNCADLLVNKFEFGITTLNYTINRSTDRAVCNCNWI